MCCAHGSSPPKRSRLKPQLLRKNIIMQNTFDLNKEISLKDFPDEITGYIVLSFSENKIVKKQLSAPEGKGFNLLPSIKSALNQKNSYDNKFALVKAKKDDLIIISNDDGTNTKIYFKTVSIAKTFSYEEAVKLCLKDDNVTINDYRSGVLTNSQPTPILIKGSHSIAVNLAENSLGVAKNDYSIVAALSGYSHILNEGNNGVAVAAQENSKIVTNGTNSLAAAIGKNSDITANGDSSIVVGLSNGSTVVANGKNSVAIATDSKVKGGLGSLLIYISKCSDGSINRINIGVVDDIEIKPNVFYIVNELGYWIEAK